MVSNSVNCYLNYNFNKCMKNIAHYLDEFIEDGSVYEHIEKFSKRKNVGETDEYIKTNRKLSREEEIRLHCHPINNKQIWKSKKNYNRKEKHKNNYI